MNPITFLREATAKYPALKYVWAVLGIVAAVAIARSWIDLRLAAFGGVIALYMMISALLFGQIARGARAQVGPLSRAAAVQLWFAVLLVNGAALTSFSSVLFDRPQLLRNIVFPENVERTIDYPENRIPLATEFPDDAYFFRNEQTGKDEAERRRIRLAIWMRWLTDGTRSKNASSQLLYVQQQGQFESNYNTFDVDLMDGTNKVKVEEAAVFVVSNEREGSAVILPTYRQMDFHKKDESPCTITLHEPKRGERVVLFLRVRSRNEQVPLPIVPTGYYFHLEKHQ
jgi:hypothetical protein